MNDSDILIMHLTNKGFKVRKFFRIYIEIVESCAPARIYINRAYSNVSVLIPFDQFGHVLLVLIPSVQPNPVVMCPFRIGCTL